MSDFAYLVPRWTRSFVPIWKRFVQAWDDVTDIGVQQKGPVLTLDSSNKWRFSVSVPSNCSLVSHRQKSGWNCSPGGPWTVRGGAVPDPPAVLQQAEQSWNLHLHRWAVAGRSRHGRIPQESAEIFVRFMLILSKSQQSFHFKHFIYPRGLFFLQTWQKLDSLTLLTVTFQKVLSFNFSILSV